MYQMAYHYNETTQIFAPIAAVRALNGLKYIHTTCMCLDNECLNEFGNGGDALPLAIVVDMEMDCAESEQNSLVNTDAQSDHG